MTVTEELRRMLDERGVEWTSERVSDGVLFTFTKDGRTYSVFARDMAGLEMWSQYLTPAQAIEATLGRGTCHNLKASWPSLFECDECGYSNDDMYYGSEWRFKFCPNCGAKVVDE